MMVEKHSGTNLGALLRKVAKNKGKKVIVRKGFVRHPDGSPTRKVEVKGYELVS